MSRSTKKYEQVNKIIPSVITKADIKELSSYCMADANGFDHLGEVLEYSDGTRNVFIKNQFGIDATVLAIAHLDISTELVPTAFQYHPSKHIVVSQALDDRLGVWALCRKLPMFIGNRGYDVLLTVGEEQGSSSAQHFDEQSEKYNWIFQLDRMGCDAVHYDFDSVEWLAALKNCGWDMNTGSFSDISMLSMGTVSAVNFGIAYKGQHTSGCYANLDLVATQLYRVAAFYKMYEAHKFPHTYKEYSRGYSHWEDKEYSQTLEEYRSVLKPYKYEYPQIGFDGKKYVRGDDLCMDCALPIGHEVGGLCEECRISLEYEEAEAIEHNEMYSRQWDYVPPRFGKHLGNESIEENK